ncbi:hypothetical protein BDK51DRAFT_32714 [Blyttiomyces helicus]|uniref:Ubiquitin-like domain-containing protein n=1 Tax=Blyttiomyces helicus TaxID=388810 RepID=A0A4P9W3H9_9FUNG|nr:hypothetical protein BDK51DRAFT_32714 [Blyttiomyces helicus]|eukprot:RKO86372.1 hypothetical protein BDK51DRAFT_32714 [Blyttiomyces helicus]
MTNSSAPAAPPTDALLHIMFSDNSGDLTITHPLAARISDLKRVIAIQKPALANHHLRLLFKGRILQNSETLGAVAGGPGDGAGGTTHLHCAVSEAPASEEQAPELRAPATGFDRLLETGFSQEEVSALRAQFHSLRGTDTNEAGRAAAAEEEWIDMGGNQPDPVSADGGQLDMFIGLCAGFFMGLMAGFLLNISFGILRFLY